MHGHGDAPRQWDPALVTKIQAILDKSAESATPVVGSTFARDDWRLDAEKFLTTWDGVRMCVVGSASKDGKPHLAAVHAGFQDDGRLTMRMFEESVRQKDFNENPRVALNKVTPDGGVMTVYGKPREIAGTVMPSRNGTGPGTIEVEIDITRIYAMQPAQARTS